MDLSCGVIRRKNNIKKERPSPFSISRTCTQFGSLARPWLVWLIRVYPKKVMDHAALRSDLRSQKS